MPWLYAAGNLVHPAETADVAALGARHAARHIAAALGGGEHPVPRAVSLLVAEPLAWVAPGGIGDDRAAPARNRLILRSRGPRRLARLEVSQNGRLLARHRARLAPGRSVTLPAGWVSRVDVAGEPVRIDVS